MGSERMDHRCCFVLCALLLVGSLCGQEADVDIARAVRDLGAPTFVVRKRARAALEAMGWEAKTALEQAAKHPDPEVAGVARQLLAAILPGVTDKTPEKQRQLVA